MRGCTCGWLLCVLNIIDTIIVTPYFASLPRDLLIVHLCSGSSTHRNRGNIVRRSSLVDNPYERLGSVDVMTF